MRLYTTTGAAQVDDPEYGSFMPDANGAFDFPDAMAVKLHGRPGWETDAARDLRIATEELERFRDPATLLAEVKKMGDSQGALTSLLAQALGLTPPAATPEAAATPTPSQPEVSSDAEAPVETAKSATPRGRGAKAAKAATPGAA